MLVDIDPQKTDSLLLRFVVAPAPTPASAAFSSLLPPPLTSGEQQEEGVTQAEVCPEGLLVAKEVARRVVQSGGAALVVDYGSSRVTKHTLRVSECVSVCVRVCVCVCVCVLYLLHPPPPLSLSLSLSPSLSLSLAQNG